MDKVIRNGQVAVMYSAGYGAGWFTWNEQFPECVFHPDIVALVEIKEAYQAEHKRAELWNDQAYQSLITDIETKATELFGEQFYAGGAKGLTVHWIEEGLAFDIQVFDGQESIEYLPGEWLVA
jgi:hypothetical protein